MYKVADKKQLWLPEVSKVERYKKEPQPRVGKVKTPKKFEIMYHPLNLKFRGKLNRWLTRLAESEKIRIEKYLDKEEIKILGLYFFPQGEKSKWLTQDDLLMHTEFNYKKKLRKKIKEILIKLWDKSKTL